jgi:hypothetical protein
MLSKKGNVGLMVVLLFGTHLLGCTVKEEGIYTRGEVIFYLTDKDEQELYVDGKYEGKICKDDPSVLRSHSGVICSKFEPGDNEHEAKVRDVGCHPFGGGWNKTVTVKVKIGSDRTQLF